MAVEAIEASEKLVFRLADASEGLHDVALLLVCQLATCVLKDVLDLFQVVPDIVNRAELMFREPDGGMPYEASFTFLEVDLIFELCRIRWGQVDSLGVLLRFLGAAPDYSPHQLAKQVEECQEKNTVQDRQGVGEGVKEAGAHYEKGHECDAVCEGCCHILVHAKLCQAVGRHYHNQNDNEDRQETERFEIEIEELPRAKEADTHNKADEDSHGFP